MSNKVAILASMESFDEIIGSRSFFAYHNHRMTIWIEKTFDVDSVAVGLLGGY